METINGNQNYTPEEIDKHHINFEYGFKMGDLYIESVKQLLLQKENLIMDALRAHLKREPTINDAKQTFLVRHVDDNPYINGLYYNETLLGYLEEPVLSDFSFGITLKYTFTPVI